MPNHYKTNALYEYLREHHAKKDFKWLIGNAWILVYGTSDGTPLLTVLAEEAAAPTIISLPWVSELADRIRGSGIPVVFLAFQSNVGGNPFFSVGETATALHPISPSAMATMFGEHKLPIKAGATLKPVNDATSSAYHEWQRSFLGAGITVVDLDLMCGLLNKNTVILELKRSYIPLNNWRPFPADYPNFSLCAHFCEKLAFRFFILYNVRHKKPFFDDIRHVALFTFDAESQSADKILEAPIEDALAFLVAQSKKALPTPQQS